MVGPKKILNWMSINVDPDVIARYQKKNKVPPAKKPVEFETRYHRTHSKNAPSIDKQGLLTFNPNIGKNTYLSNADDYHNIWLANNATEIPVLRGLLKDSPQDVTTYKVRMPKQWYLESPRFYMPGGRGAGKLKPQPKDKPRLTDEGAYKIDLIGNDIPRQYLQKLPVFNRDRVDLIGIIDDINPNIDRNLYHDVTNNLLGEFRNYNRVFGKGPKYNKPVSQTWARITPSEELLRFMFPITYKYDIYRDFLQTANKLKHEFASLPPGIQVSPREMLDRTLSITSYDLFPETGVLGSNVTAKLKPTNITQLAQGSISRAIEDLPEFETAQKLRRPSRMDWDAFNMYYNAGHSPKRALMEGYVPGQYISWINDKPRAKQLKWPSFGEGAITRGMQAEEPIQYRLGNATDIINADDENLLKLVKLSNYGTERLPGQIGNPKMQSMLNTYIDRLPMQYLSNMVNHQQPLSPLSEGPYRNYINERYTARNQQLADLRDAEDKLAIEISKHKRLHESALHRLFELMDQHRRLSNPRAGDFPPGFINMNGVYQVLHQFKSLDKLSDQDQARAKRILHDLEKQYNQRLK